MPLITWSIESQTVRRVCDELRSSRVRCGARAWPNRTRATRSAWAAFDAPTVSQSPKIDRQLRTTNSSAVMRRRISASW